MEEGHCHSNIVKKLFNMPSVVTNIMNNLEAVDVANCLRANKDFRMMLVNALRETKQLQTDLDEKTSRFAATSGHLQTRDSGLLEESLPQPIIFGFGINDRLWLFRRNLGGYAIELNIHNFQSHTEKEFKRILLLYNDRPRVRFLPSSNPKILIQDSKKVMLFAIKRREKSQSDKYEIVLEKNHKEWKGFEHMIFDSERMALGDDCIFDCIKSYEDMMNLCDGFTLYNEDGNGRLVDVNIKFQCKPHTVLEKGIYLMVTTDTGVHMLDSSTGKTIWTKNNTPQLISPQAFLTRNFCGFMYVHYTERTNFDESGYFRLLLLDTKTGDEIYHGNCWDFFWTIEDNPEECHPQVIVQNNYLLACSTHDGSIEPQNSGEGNTLICIKYDPKSKTCKVRHSSTGITAALLSRAILDERTIKTSGELYHEDIKPFQCNAEIVFGTINLLGFAFKSVVVGHLSFNYDGIESQYYSSKTIFTVDLDKLLEMYDPAAILAAVHFPLKENILENYHRYPKGHYRPWVDYYPYYQTSEDGTSNLTGIVEVFSDEGQQKSKLHSFRKSLEVHDIS